MLTDKPEPVTGFDPVFYYVKSCTGKTNSPADNVYNVVSCFGDNKTARKRPDWVAVSSSGKAIRTNRKHRFLWDHICPSVKEYKTHLFDLLDKTSKANVTGIHLDCIGFPRSEYCICQRCTEGQKENNLGFAEWRSQIVNDFVKEASEIVKGEGKGFSITVLPDPYFGKERYGEDIFSLAKYVDFFLVPLYDLTYSTTYWLENIAFGFNKQLKKPFFVEIYATNPGPKLKNILRSIVALSDYVEGVILATHDSSLAKEIQKGIVNDKEITSFLDRHSCNSMREIS